MNGEKWKKEMKGITLIALVITIIVLLILAGVAISTLTGESGILTQTQKAKEETEIASELEQVELAVTQAMIAGNGTVTYEGLYHAFLSNFGYEIEEGDLPYTFESDNKKYVIFANGSVVQLEKGTDNAQTIKASDYGKYVNYELLEESTSTYSGKWQILFTDTENLYLISEGYEETARLGDYVQNYTGSIELANESKYPAAPKWLKGFKDNTGNWYTNNQLNMKSTLYLLDSTGVWNAKYKNGYADYAIGGATLEMLCKSYDDVKDTNNLSLAVTDNTGHTGWYGYPQVLTENLREKVNNLTYLWCPSFYYWLACPSIDASNHVNTVSAYWKKVITLNYNYNDPGISIRPVVCLNSNVLLTWDSSTNAYNLH